MTNQEIAAALRNLADQIAPFPAGVSEKSLLEKAHAIQDSRKATPAQVQQFNVGGRQPTAFRVVSNYRDDIDLSGQGAPGGIPCFDRPGTGGVSAFDGFNDIQALNREIVQKFGGSAGVQAYVGSDWYWVATGEKLAETDMASVDGVANYVKANSLTVG